MLFEPCPIPYQLDLNLVTASATCAVLRALAGDSSVATHTPAPNGLLGGYPVKVSAQGVTLDLAETWSQEEAEAVNRASLPWDGIAEIDCNGTVTFTEETAAALQALTGEPFATLSVEDARLKARILHAVLMS